MIGVDDIVTAVSGVAGKLIDRLWPDPAQAAQAKLELLKMQQTGELAQLAADTDLMKGQIQVDNTEAANANVWVAGWRPFIGWVGGAALANHFIIAPYFTWIAALFHSTANVPDPQIMDLIVLVSGMLGFGGLRTVEKLKNVVGQH